jgi:dihydrofolate reductase
MPIGRSKLRKIIASTFVTLDGVMQAPGGPEEDPTGCFTQGGWSFTYWDDMMNQVIGQSMSQPFDLLLGRKTYEIFAAHWPYAGENPVTERFNRTTKYVASRTLNKLDWINSQLIKADVAKEVGRFKTGDGPDLQVQGSSVLLQTLIGAQLIDEYRLWIVPPRSGARQTAVRKWRRSAWAFAYRHKIIFDRCADQHVSAYWGGHDRIVCP